MRLGAGIWAVTLAGARRRDAPIYDRSFIKPSHAHVNPTGGCVGIFPNRHAIIRLVGAVLAEQNDEWAEGRRYLSLDILTKSRLTPQPTQQEDTPLQLSA